MRIKLLFYVEVLEEGGAERRVGHLARGLMAAAFKPQWPIHAPGGPVGDRLCLAGIPVPERRRAAFRQP